MNLEEEHGLRRGRSARVVPGNKPPLKYHKSDFLVKVPEKGRAVFTTKEFHRGDFLLTYDGELIDAQEGERREAIKETGFRYFFCWKGKKFCLDASVEPLDEPGLGRLVNHGWKGEINSKMRALEGINSKPVLALFALKTILPYEEILYDYGLPASFTFPPPPPPPPASTVTSEYLENHQESEDMSVTTCQDSNVLGVETESAPEGHDVLDSSHISSVSTLSDRGTDTDVRAKNAISEPNSLENSPPRESLSSPDKQLTKDSHNCCKNGEKNEGAYHDKEVFAVSTESVPQVQDMLNSNHISSVSTLSDRQAVTEIRENVMSEINPLENPPPQESSFSSDEQSKKENHKCQENENIIQRACHNNDILALVTESLQEAHEVLESGDKLSVSTLPNRGADTDVRQKNVIPEPNRFGHPPPPPPLESLSLSDNNHSRKNNHKCHEREDIIQRACHDNDENVDAVREILSSSVITISDKVEDSVVDCEESILSNNESDSQSVVPDCEDDCDPHFYNGNKESSSHHNGTSGMQLPGLPTTLSSGYSPDAITSDIDDNDKSDNNSEDSDSEDDRDPDYIYEENSSDENDDNCSEPHPRLSVTPLSQDGVPKRAHKVSEKLPSHAETSSSNEQSSRSGTEKGGDDRVYVMRTHNDGQSRCYDKIALCLFCSKPQKKLQVHLLQHPDRVEVAQYLAETAQEKKNELLSKIRNRGNHIHNYNVLEKGEGGLVVVYRPNYEANPDDYQPCYHCLGWYARTEMWKHKCSINQKNEDGTAKKRANVRSGRLLLPPASNIEPTELLHKVLNGLRSDPIAMCIKQDELILALGKQLSFKLAHDEDNYNSIRCKLREVARLVLEYRTCSGKENADLSSLISPTEFDLVLQAVRDVTGFDAESHLFGIPSLARKLGHSLKKAASLLLSKAIKEEDPGLEKKCRDFITLYEKDWETEISSHALRTMYQQKRNNPKLLPVTADVVSLSNYLRMRAETCLENLKGQETEDKMKSWKKLNQVVLTHLIVFNRRRQGEVSKMTLNDYSQCKKGESHMVEGQMEMLEKWEQHMVKLLWRVEVVGKRGRTVPILMTEFAKSCIDTLLHHRAQAGVNPINTYLFAVPKSDVSSHLRGCDTLREHSKMCGAKQPALLRSTRLTKHIATMTQLMDLRDNELDVLANYMGHDIRIHRQFYRLPDAAQQVAKISKILFAMEGKGGNPTELLGNTKEIDELQINPNEELDIGESNGETTDEDSDENMETHEDVENMRPLGDVESVPAHEDEEDMEALEDDENMEPSKPTQKGQKRKRQDVIHNQAPAQQPKVSRVKWTCEEKSAVFRQLGPYIESKKLPGKREIEKCLKAERHLKNRTWKNVKDFVRNILTTKARASQKKYFLI